MPPDLKISAKVGGTPTPTAELAERDSSTSSPTAFAGQGSWVMSSLPGCFDERERVHGLLRDLVAKFPPAGTRLPPGTVVLRGECRVEVGAHDVRIARGDDRLRVPPEARLYREGDRLTLVSISGRQAEIRRY